MYVDLTAIILGILVLVLPPGYALTLAVLPKTRIENHERATLALVSGISLNVLVMFFLNGLAGIPLNSSTLAAEIIASTILFFGIYLLRTRELPYIYIEDHGFSGLLRGFTLAAFLASIMLLTYGIHQGCGYPYVLDEWHHLAQGMHAIDAEGIVLKNPYYKTNGEGLESGFFEKGFHLLIAEIFLATGREPVSVYVILPALTAALTALCAFTLTCRVTGSFNSGLLSMLFFATLQSNIELLGPWFFVPLSLGFAYIYAVFYMAVEGLERRSPARLFLSAFNLLALAFIHPWSAGFVIPVILIYIASRPDIVRGNVKGLLMLLLLPLLSFAYILGIIWKGDLLASVEYFAERYLVRTLEIPVWRPGGIANPFYVAGFYGLVPLLLALIGIAYTIFRKSTKERILISWTLLMFTIMVLYHLTGSTILAPYERIIYYMALSMVPLSAIGLTVVLERLSLRVQNRFLAVFLSLLLITAVMAPVLSTYQKNKERLYRIVDDRSYAALKTLGQVIGEGNVVLARTEISSAIYPVTKNHVVSISPGQLGAGERGLEDNRLFFKSGCGVKKGIVDKYEVDYVFLDYADRVECDFLSGIYTSKGFYIYRVEKPEDGNP
ncbi:MAG: hypothetical protein JW724_05195 [Candidatus Altiarchaeota archaeon]|nr:hypothetical protein [Candidatus Altiarchaeota archaeon]